ncbi:MAG: hypothetical protein HXL16_02345 [Peptostreptococcaceae bacterium]|nr:hypothetical protein [Peptostreptococcaceae bacterium]
MFVLKVVPGTEMVTKKLIEDKGYKALCPRKIKTLRRKYRYTEVEKVIFTGYLFLDIELISDKDYYKIKGIVNVIGFLDSKHNLDDVDIKYIKLLNNNDKAIDKILVSFDEKRKAIVYNLDTSKSNNYLNTRNVLRVNARDQTITFSFKIDNLDKNVTFNYEEI